MRKQSHQPSGHRWLRGVYFRHLGEGFTPSPYPLPWGQGGGAAGCRRALERFFSHPSALLFCIVFSMPFLIDFGPILAPKIDPKSLQNRSKMGVKRDAKNHDEKSRIPKPFWDDFSSIFDQFSRPSWKPSAPLFKAFLQTCAIKTQR